MKNLKWFVAFLIVATLFGGILGCKPEVEILSDKTAPADVTELTVQAANGNAVLNWKNPADADFAGVQVAMSPAEGTLKNAVSLGKEVTRLDVSGLTVGKEYTFTVKAFDESLNYSEGVEAKAKVADTSDKTAPADVTELTATNKDASVLLTWTDATDEDIYGYEVTWNKNASAAKESNSMMVAPGANGCYISNLTNGTEYTFTVKTVDTSGNKSAGVTKTITPSIIEKAPLKIALEPNTTERTNQDVVITVNATTDSESEIKSITYVEGTESKIDTVLAGIDITESKEITATENATFTVAVTDTAGRCELAFVTVNNIDKEAPAQVANVMPSYSRNNNAITLSWTNPADEDFAGTEIVYGKTDSEETTTLTFDKNTTPATIENIAADDSEYTIAIKSKDDVGNLSEAKIVTVVAATRDAKITSVSIPVAGTNYAGEVLPVTIIGEYFTAPDVTASGFTSTGATLNNVTIISDTKATAEITCPYAAGTTNVTVSYGESSATGTLKVVAEENCYSVGDILFTDGTRIKAENVQCGVPDSQLSKAFAVITSVSYGGGVGKAVGLQKSSSTLMWAPENTTGYSTNFTGIQATHSGYTILTFSGDIDGSDNWEYICSIDPEGTKDPATNYPAFNFALTYGTQAGLTETEYENGWYVPSVAELYDVYTNKEVVQTSLNAVGGFTLGTSYYWSSSQYASNDNYACKVYFDDGYVYYSEKYSNASVFVLQAFNAEQFNNYEYNTEISSVEIPTIAEGFVGEVPVTITGKDLIQKITVSGLTISTIYYISDAIAIAYATTTGTETTITVSCGTASATTTLKVIESVASSYAVGDIILTNGTKVSVNDVTTYTIDENNKPIGVVAMISDVYGVPTPKVIGLQKSAGNLRWAPGDTTGYNTEFTNIVCEPSQTGSDAALTAVTFTGDTEGSDNWEYICIKDPEGTQDAATNYPIFNFANTYGTTAGLTGTDYENGWYVPSIAELCEVYKNQKVIQTSLTKADNTPLTTAVSNGETSKSANVPFTVI